MACLCGLIATRSHVLLESSLVEQACGVPSPTELPLVVDGQISTPIGADNPSLKQKLEIGRDPYSLAPNFE